jgi:hypothetical protein
MDDDPIDLSPLDPSSDTQRWEQMVRSLSARAASNTQHPVLIDLVRWARPVLAIAAAAAILAWMPSLFSKKQNEPADPVAALVTWAGRDEVPPTDELLRLLGDANGR